MASIPTVPIWGPTRTTTFFTAVTVIDLSTDIILNFPTLSPLPNSYSTTWVTLEGSLVGIDLPWLILSQEVATVFNTEGSILETVAITQSASLPSTGISITTTGNPSKGQTTSTSSSSVYLATLTPVPNPPSSISSCSAWKCWTKGQQAGTLIAIVLISLGILAVIWWGLIRKRKNGEMRRGRDIERDGESKQTGIDGTNPGSRPSSNHAYGTHTNDSRSSRRRHFSGDTTAFGISTKRHSWSPPRTRVMYGGGSPSRTRAMDFERPLPTAQKKCDNNIEIPLVVASGGATNERRQSKEPSKARPTTPVRRRRTRLASPSKYITKAREMRELEKPGRNERENAQGGRKSEEARNDDGRNRNLARPRERPRSYSPPPQGQSSSENSKPKPKRRNSNSETKPDGPSKWLLLLPLALEAVHLMSEPKGGWNSYLPEHKKHKPRIEKLANDFLEGKHHKHSSHDRDRDHFSRKNEGERTPRPRPPILKRSSSADMAYSRYKPPRDRSRRPGQGGRESASGPAQGGSPVRRNHSMRMHEPDQPSRRRSTRRDVRARGRSMGRD